MTTTTDGKTVHVHRADATRDEPVQPVTIAIDLEQPPYGAGWTDYARDAKALFTADATKIADALRDALPGGTLDALVAELMTRRAVLFRVRLDAEESS